MTTKIDTAIFTPMTGKRLQTSRRAAGISQTEMGALIGCSRHSVSYWETKVGPIKTRFGVPARMLVVLGIQTLPINCISYRAREHGVLGWVDRQQEALDKKSAHSRAKAAIRAAQHRQQCGAKTRKGHPCSNKSEPGRRRCKFHGGLSTGPKTIGGRTKIAEAQRSRWAAYKYSNSGQ